MDERQHLALHGIRERDRRAVVDLAAIEDAVGVCIHDRDEMIPSWRNVWYPESPERICVLAVREAIGEADGFDVCVRDMAPSDPVEDLPANERWRRRRTGRERVPMLERVGVSTEVGHAGELRNGVRRVRKPPTSARPDLDPAAPPSDLDASASWR